MSLKEKLFKSLLNLKDVKYTDYHVAINSVCKADTAIRVLFHIGKKNINFTDEEKRDLGNLLIDGFGAIVRNIQHTFFRYRTRLELEVLVKRSALQFLIEKYGEFPAKDSTLKDELEKSNFKKCIQVLDYIIKKYRDYYDSDEGNCDPETAGVSDIPATHTWWFE